jgi:hypothetical protein
LTSALVAGEWSASAPAALLQEREALKKKISLLYRDCNSYPSALAFAIPAAIFQLL